MSDDPRFLFEQPEYIQIAKLDPETAAKIREIIENNVPIVDYLKYNFYTNEGQDLSSLSYDELGTLAASLDMQLNDLTSCEDTNSDTVTAVTARLAAVERERMDRPEYIAAFYSEEPEGDDF